jgi:glycyl-tRNA synthetase beta chain
MSAHMHQFLVELGTEELPPKSLLTLSTEFRNHLEAGLKNLGVEYSAITPFASPRRLALLVEGLPESTPVKSLVIWGPPANVAFDANGKPTKAAEAFAAKNGVSVADLTNASDGKVEKLKCEVKTGGESLTQLLPGLVDHALAQLPIAKRMRWGAKRDEFVRPVKWLVMLFDEQIIPCSILGVAAGNQTRGHRFHCDRNLTVTSPAIYKTLLLEEGKVVADFAERREIVRNEVMSAGQKLGGKAVIDVDLLDEVTALVEWPVALAGGFEERFLAVPAEALISSMKEHQKYFHVVDKKGALLPHFITLANIESADPAQVIAGNEKVIRPRLSDAAFFFETDKKQALTDHREKLRNVVFQAQLGSVYDKTERVSVLAGYVARKLNANYRWAERAGTLSKADLATAMVYEFADMQGIAGFYYGQNDGEEKEVYWALKEQYLPKFAGDELPATTTGAILALADRVDTLAGIFGLGQVPTGSKDPFGLRRASVAVLRILVEKKYNLDLYDLLEEAVELYPSLPQGKKCLDVALNYMLERFRAWYEEQNIPAVVYQAVAAKGITNPLDIDNRVQAVAAFYQLPEAEALAAANKRVSNILAKQPALDVSVNPALLQEPAEQQLAQQVAALKQQVAPLFANRRYKEALAALAGLRASVDQFFDKVMVMVEDPQLRANRLALLSGLRDLFWEVADISHLAVSQ